MATFRLTIRCTSAAFRDDDEIKCGGDDALATRAEIARILRGLYSDFIEDVDATITSGPISDANGTAVGEWSID